MSYQLMTGGVCGLPCTILFFSAAAMQAKFGEKNRRAPFSINNEITRKRDAIATALPCLQNI